MLNKIDRAYIQAYPDIYVKTYDDEDSLYKTRWLVSMGMIETLDIKGELVEFGRG